MSEKEKPEKPVAPENKNTTATDTSVRPETKMINGNNVE